ncbi:MAG TPA: radical SAM protein [Nitrospinaceae bacterium]|nr:radical SAM protein [Nitrospina sp.]HIN87159.1 radical SAM protein [Nitrospinaceae bacterium]
MTDEHRIDGHKLMLHPERVAQWKKGQGNWEEARSIYPVYVEISPVGACNHRCTFCAVDYIGYQNRSLDPDVLKNSLKDMAQLGVLSVMFAGEGEPALYKSLPEVLDLCSNIGIDTSITTNLVPFTKTNVNSFVKNCKWIKASINAGTRETYSQIHQCDPADFDRVLKNVELAVETREKNRYSCTIGVQMVLLPENNNEAYLLAEKLKGLGADYFVIKPYSQHNSSTTRKYENIEYQQNLTLEDDLAELNSDSFNIVYRKLTIQRVIANEYDFKVCHATPFFWAYIMASGDVYGCSAYLEDEKFCYGNLSEQSFQQIWEGERRRKNFHFVKDDLDIEDCRMNCRMWSVNQYLWELNHPGSHVNFI